MHARKAMGSDMKLFAKNFNTQDLIQMALQQEGSSYTSRIHVKQEAVPLPTDKSN